MARGFVVVSRAVGLLSTCDLDKNVDDSVDGESEEMMAGDVKKCSWLSTANLEWAEFVGLLIVDRQELQSDEDFGPSSNKDRAVSGRRSRARWVVWKWMGWGMRAGRRGRDGQGPRCGGGRRPARILLSAEVPE